jgi:hypothetical protein
MYDRQATQSGIIPPLESENAQPPRAIILHDHALKPRTIGFPALQRTEPKIVRFASPLYARCMSLDVVWCTDCLILSVWDAGAELQVRRPGDLTEFYLLFTSSPRPVFRRCRRIRTWGDVMEAAYQKKRPDFHLKPELAHDS